MLVISPWRIALVSAPIMLLLLLLLLLRPEESGSGG
jgi:hypothetical protein